MKQASKIFLISLLAICGLVLLTPNLAAAHVLKQDNGVSGVLHIPPDDNPSAGKPTQLAVSFASDAGTFSLARCDCQVTVKQDSRTIQTVPLKPALNGATLEAAGAVTFPSIAVYDVVVSGTSTDGSFHNFSLDYIVRVASGTAAVSKSNGSATGGTDVVIVSIASIAIVGLVAYAAIRSGGRYSTSSVKQSKTLRRK